MIIVGNKIQQTSKNNYAWQIYNKKNTTHLTLCESLKNLLSNLALPNVPPPIAKKLKIFVDILSHKQSMIKKILITTISGKKKVR